MMQRDILIIGAGVFGCAIAWALSRRGLGERVLLLERGQPGGGATSRAAALVTRVRDNPLQAALAQATFEAIAALEGGGEDVGRRRVGELHVTPLEGEAALRERVERCAARGVAHRWLGTDEALALAPWLAPSAVGRAVLFPEEGYVEPYQLAAAYLRGARQRGAQLRAESRVSRITVTAGRVSGVELDDGSHLSARVVINGAGAWANLLSVPLGLPLPMAPVRSQYWITEPAAQIRRDGAVVMLPAIRAYARPEVGALLFGLRERQAAVADPRQLPEDLAGFVFDPSDPEGWRNLSEGAEALAAYFPALNQLGIAHYITGPSNYTVDGQLVLGASPQLAGLYVASGCNGSGIAYSGGVGQFIADLVCGASPGVPTAPCAPARHGDFDPYSPAFLQACAAARAGKSTG